MCKRMKKKIIEKLVERKTTSQVECCGGVRSRFVRGFEGNSFESFDARFHRRGLDFHSIDLMEIR